MTTRLWSSLGATALLGALSIACGGAALPHVQSEVAATAPLGDSYVLIPLPSEDEGLLGRILERTPEAGRSLDEVSRPNPCADKLASKATMPSSNSFEDAQELAAGATARAILGVYGFQADASQASHFVYKLKTTKQASQRDTNDYVECCKKTSCGIGYVSALVYGEGEYATAQETTAKGSVTMAAVSAGGNVSLKTLHKRSVKGWLAALVTITDRKAADSVGTLGIAETAGIAGLSMPEQLKDVYEHNKLQVDGAGDGYKFQVASGEVLNENEFVRRYRGMTGLGDLDDAERRRNWGSVVLWGGITAVGAGLFVYGLTDSSDCSRSVNGTCEETKRSGIGTLSMIAGAPLGVVGGIGLLIALLNPDGKPTDHALTDADARLYVAKYNRAFLKKTARDVKRVGAVELEPVVGTSFAGLSGRF